MGEPGDSPPPSCTLCPQVVAAMCTELCKLERVIWKFVILVSLLLWRELAVTLGMSDTGSLPRTGLSHEPRGPPQRGMHVAHFQPVPRQPVVLGLHPDHLDRVTDPLASKGSGARIPENIHLRADTHVAILWPSFLSVSRGGCVLTTSPVLGCTPPSTHPRWQSNRDGKCRKFRCRKAT